MIKRIRKYNPMQVRDIEAKYELEYKKHAKHCAEGNYWESKEDYESCIIHQQVIDILDNPAKYIRLIVNND